MPANCKRAPIGGGIRWNWAAPFSVLALVWSGAAQAQEEAPQPQAEPVAPEAGTEQTTEDSETEGAVAPSEEKEQPEADEASSEEPDDVSAQLAEMQKRHDAQMAALEARLGDVETAREEAEIAALTAEEDSAADQEILRIYGFMDLGFQKFWADDASLAASIFETNAWTFMLGNVNLYFDANPHPDWRGLAEIRFTNAPHGSVVNPGGLGGEFERADTFQYDPHSTGVNGPMWGGYTVIERAWIEWKRHEVLRVRAGNFFTPFGIWNVDHGTPTLIALQLPQFIQQRFIPLRQTGVQALGSVFFGEWELGYHAWVTNGRAVFSNLDFNDDKAYGGRVFLHDAHGDFDAKLAMSYHHGRVANKVVSLDGVQPLEFSNEETLAYVENAIGVDLSVDVGKTHFRAEGVAQLRQWDEGKRDPRGFTSPIDDSYLADHWRYDVYAVLAHELPWWGIEPYVAGEFVQQQWELPDVFVSASGGVNVQFTPSMSLKNQYTTSYFRDWQKESDGDPSVNDARSWTTRLVMAF